MGFPQRVALNLSQAQPALALLNLNKLSNAGDSNSAADDAEENPLLRLFGYKPEKKDSKSIFCCFGIGS